MVRQARAPRLVLVLSENWTMTSPRDLRGLVRIAQEAEDAGIDGVMLSEHIVLGASAGARGRPENPRDYAAPGNQDPDMPWPDSIVLMSAIAAATTRLRMIGAAIIAPLRHPLLLAHQLATLDLLAEGRLVVQPTVSWHQEEYAALGVPFRQRGELLDEHLAAWQRLWRDGAVSFEGRFYSFADVYLEPKPWRLDGPRLWFGGSTVGPWIIRRLLAHGHGFHPFGQPTESEMLLLAEQMAAAGRDVSELEIVGGIRGRFGSADAVADLAEAAEAIPAQLAAGYTTICFKPSQFTDDPAEVGALCRRLVSLSSR
ncbi:MAG: TIGR03619 family F420-dependent LLM class oxidoreductase [Actinomycetota bacterium]|nr:TIGR03619 family F420-dependent LLM class oxidoreductase [Actinomycetota bacterium]